MVELTQPPRQPGSVRPLLCALSALVVLTACGERPGEATRAEIAAREGISHPMVGHPAPDFVGDSLTPGGWLPLRGMRETPIAILFFQPGSPFAIELVREFNRMRNDRSMAPTRFMGVVHDTPEAIQQFQRVQGFDLPILRDPGSIAQRYGIGATATVVLLDVDHIVRFRLDGFVGADFRPRLEATEVALRRLPDQRAAVARSIHLEYGEYERLPDLLTEALDGGLVHLVETRGRVIVLMFLDSTCSWCGDRLSSVMEIIEERDSGEVDAVGVVIDAPDERTIAPLRRLDPRIRILLDKRQATVIKLQDIEAPELLVVDREGFVRYRAPRDPGKDGEWLAQLRLQLARVLDGTPAPANESSPGPPLGARVAHVGDNACRKCHPSEYLQWRSTPHAAAISSLVQADRAGDDSCTPCHTTGSGLRGGFGDPLISASMTNVQCESCHGPGFDHISVPRELRRQTIYGLSGGCSGCDIERFCTGCHDAENDPDFDLATAFPEITH